MTFAEELKEFRDKHSLSQFKLAEIIGVSPRTLWGYEDGQNATEIKQQGARFAMQEWARKNIAKSARQCAKPAK